MAAGSVPIVSDLPANHEWVTDGANGVIVVGSEDAALTMSLTDILVRLASDPADTRRLAMAASTSPAVQAVDFGAEMARVQMAYDALAR